MNKEIPPQFAVGARVRIVRVTFSTSQPHSEFIGKIGKVQKLVPSIGAVVVLTDDGATRVCFPENLELMG
jgi:ribosomal protein L21E